MRATMIKILGCLLIGWLNTAVALEELLTPDHPDRYQVQEGDTLWSIAGKFLNEPWRWSEVWHPSSNAQDANLIYPGDEIVLVVDGDKVELTLTREQDTPVATQQLKTIKLTQNVRKLPAIQAIPSIPLNKIGPFLSDSEILSMECLAKAPRILAVDEERLLLGVGNRFYAKPLAYKVGDSVSLFRPGAVLHDPKTNAILGQVAVFLGTAVVENKAAMTSFIVTRVAEEIRVGDKMLLTDDFHFDPYFFPKTPDTTSEGSILNVLGGINQVSQSQVVTISGGLDIHRKQGDVLDVYQNRQDLPTRIVKEKQFEEEMGEKSINYQFAPIDVGRVIVFRVFDKVSLALVTDAVRPLYLQDIVKAPHAER